MLFLYNSLFCVSDTCNAMSSRNSTLYLLWLLMMLKITVESIKVIGGKQTAIQGQNVSFPCTLTEMPATDDISQISWKRKTGQNPVYSDFFTISPEYGAEPVNAGHDASRFKFIGSLNETNGSIQLSNVTLLDEGVYSCIFTLFPSGSYRTEMPLTVLVPPVSSLKIKVPVPVVGEDWVTYASCTAAGAKPPAEVTWDTGSSQGALRVVSNSTQHANGTTTTISHLVGTPTRDINHLLVQCVVKQHALATEDTLPFAIEVHYAPLSVNIRETSKDVLECVSDSSPKARYTWSRANQSWPRSGISAEGDVLQLVSPTSDLGGLYVCEASNPYGRKDGSLYVYYATATGGCIACWTVLVFSMIAVAVAVGLALWYYKSKYGVLPWREEVVFQRPPGDDENQVEVEEKMEEKEVQETRS